MLSNPDAFVDFALSICQNADRIWDSADFRLKIKLQKVLFPEGFAYDIDKHEYRTQNLNIIFTSINWLSTTTKEKETNASGKNVNRSALVAPIEQMWNFFIEDFMYTRISAL